MRLFLLCVAAISFPQTPPEPGLGQKKGLHKREDDETAKCKFFFL